MPENAPRVVRPQAPLGEAGVRNRWGRRSHGFTGPGIQFRGWTRSSWGFIPWVDQNPAPGCPNWLPFLSWPSKMGCFQEPLGPAWHLISKEARGISLWFAVPSHQLRCTKPLSKKKIVFFLQASAHLRVSRWDIPSHLESSVK